MIIRIQLILYRFFFYGTISKFLSKSEKNAILSCFFLPIAQSDNKGIRLSIVSECDIMEHPTHTHIHPYIYIHILSQVTFYIF